MDGKIIDTHCLGRVKTMGVHAFHAFLKFIRDSQGLVTGMLLNGRQITGVRFARR
jgi:hypothetical protein